nr:hypothetical protein [uncultured Prevotella sp.]
MDGDSFKHTFIFLKHAAKIQLIFKNPNKNKQNQAFPNQKIHFIDAFPNQKLSSSLHFQTKKNSVSMHIQTKNPYLGYYYYSKKGGCTTEYHNTPCAGSLLFSAAIISENKQYENA